MTLRDWLARKRLERRYPERHWRLSMAHGVLILAKPDGTRQRVALGTLSRIAIRTQDIGPWGADLWWLLFGADGRVALRFPGGAAGGKPVIDALMALPGFNHAAMLGAMGCTANRVFLVWRAGSPLQRNS